MASQSGQNMGYLVILLIHLVLHVLLVHLVILLIHLVISLNQIPFSNIIIAISIITTWNGYITILIIDITKRISNIT